MKVLVCFSFLLAVACSAPQWPISYPLGIGSGVWPLGLSHYGLKTFPYSLHDSPYIYPVGGVPIIKEINGEMKEIKSDIPVHMIKEFKSDFPLHMMKEYKTEYPINMMKEYKTEYPIHMMKELKVELPVVMDKSYELPKPVEETAEVKKAKEAFMVEWEKAARAALAAPDVNVRRRRDLSSVVLPTAAHLPFVGHSTPYVMPYSYSYPYASMGLNAVKIY